MEKFEGESRLEYLARVLTAYMEEHGHNLIEYDGTFCDGQCLAQDFTNEIDCLPKEAEV